MARYWKIRESFGEKEMDEATEAYECGYEDGYKAAKAEMAEGSMGERMGRMGERMNYRSGMGEGYMGERRGRDSMGRYR